jgi:hypothetical protein
MVTTARRDLLGHGFAHVPYADGEEHLFERYAATGGDAVDHLGGALLAPTFSQFQQFLLGEVVEFCDVLDQSPLDQFGHGFTAQSFDRHHLAAYEMFDATDDLWRAGMFVGTVMLCFAFVTHQGCVALRACKRKGDRSCIHRTRFQVHTDDLGDDLPHLFHLHLVPDVQVEFCDLIGVVQGCTLHRGSS